MTWLEGIAEDGFARGDPKAWRGHLRQYHYFVCYQYCGSDDDRGSGQVNLLLTRLLEGPEQMEQGAVKCTGPGRPKQYPDRIVGDKGYSFPLVRRFLCPPLSAADRSASRQPTSPRGNWQRHLPPARFHEWSLSCGGDQEALQVEGEILDPGGK